LLDLTYNAAGLLASVTDSASRTTRYSYDAANEHLVSVESYDGRITRYTYDIGTTPATHHALRSIEAPGGVTRQYAYDSFGRLSSTLIMNGPMPGEIHERVTYEYQSTGEVVARNGTMEARR